MQSASEQNEVDKHNRAVIQNWLEREQWDGILLGNLDLLGAGLLHWLLKQDLEVLHHVGFVNSPYGIDQQPDVENYRILAASHAVKNNLIEEGIRATNASIVYPGAHDVWSELNTYRIPEKQENPYMFCSNEAKHTTKSPSSMDKGIQSCKPEWAFKNYIDE